MSFAAPAVHIIHPKSWLTVQWKVKLAIVSCNKRDWGQVYKSWVTSEVNSPPVDADCIGKIGAFSTKASTYQLRE